MKPATVLLTLSLCIWIVCFAGCGSKEIYKSASESKGTKITEEIDPFALGDEFALIQQKKPQNQLEKPSKTEEQPEQPAERDEVPKPDENNINPVIDDTETSDDTAGETLGFRVHIGMFSNESEAQQFAKKAETRIDEKIYVIYKAPFFRVRVGDFKTKKEADAYVKHLKSIGYRIAWWIRTAINTNNERNVP